MKLSKISPVQTEATAGVYDILKLNDFSEMSLLHTLRVRYFKDKIYTFVGPILISINPYEDCASRYSDARIIEYHTTKGTALEPHLFEVRL